MKELKTVERYRTFKHRKGSIYRYNCHDDDGYHIWYDELKANKCWEGHKVLIKDEKEWNELCELYPWKS